uniref:Secreted protein n=1 Tax=Meloidogyne hapla TaxID=6305 RepID=A0A1I8BEU9_MELHA
MVAGGFIAAVAFFVSGIVQLRINLTLPEFADDGQAFVSIVNTFAKCPLEITHLETGETRLMLPNTSLINDKTQNRIEMFRVLLGQNKWKIDGIGDDCTELKLEMPKIYEFDIKEPMSFITITTKGAFLSSAETEKPTGGSGQFKIAVIMAMENEKNEHNNKLLAFCRNDQKCNQHDGKVVNVPFTLLSKCSLHTTSRVEGTSQLYREL